MKSLVLLGLLFPMFASAALVDPKLQNFARTLSGTQKVLALVDVRGLRPFPYRQSPSVIRKYLAEETLAAWGKAQQNLSSQIASGDVRLLETHSINISFMLQVTPAGLRALAQIPGISKIYADVVTTNAKPVSRQNVFGGIAPSMPYDISAMALDQMIKAYPQINGNGVLVGHIDTGVDGKHASLAGKIAVFYDAATATIKDPVDSDEHGTHTAGTIVGAPKDGFPMGVAPGARLVSSSALSGYTEMLRAMAFMMNPDRKPESNLQVRLVSNSWNCEGANDLEAFYRAIAAWEAAGILPVFSAGNNGPRPQTITKPHEHPNAFSAAAFGPNGKAADFSSRGPGIFNGKPTQKPDVAAPGVQIVSAKPGGGFQGMSGTSMAAPHLAGLAALLYQVQPNLDPAKMREVIFRSADFVNAEGEALAQPEWNPVFGFGKINALKAVNLLKNWMGQKTAAWGQFMSPVRDLVEGFSSMTKFSSQEQGIPENTFAGFETDSSLWIQGQDL